jgi:hypothetical protein
MLNVELDECLPIEVSICRNELKLAHVRAPGDSP